MEIKKKTWEKPQLIVLARATADESVLLHCKLINAPTGGGPAAGSQDSCAEATTNCSSCQARAGS